MRSLLYATTVLVLFGAGLANVTNKTAGLRMVSAASAALAAKTPINGMIAKTLCGEPPPAQSKKWITAWTASVQGPYPSGFALLQPDLSLVFPDPARGADDQSFRMIVQFESSAVSAGTNRRVTFGGQEWIEIAAGKDAWSDAVLLPFVSEDDAGSFLGRKLAVSFHVRGESGPMTWHAKALTTSYLTMPHAGAVSRREDEAAFPFSTTSVFFLDAVDVMADAGTKLVVAFGDSITDGMGASLNGQDRWPDVLSRRLHDRFGDRVAVVNAGIAGNRILKPHFYSAKNPDASGPAALQRLHRDILSLSGVSAVIWLQGINDLEPHGQASLTELEQAITSGVRAMRSAGPAVRMVGATLTSAGGNPEFGAREEDRKALNAFIRASGLFDAVIDFEGATINPWSGALKSEYVVPTNGVSTEDGLHPNRAGYLAMAGTIDLDALVREIATEPSS
jgi:lysophospholipase L1-like esterase